MGRNPELAEEFMASMKLIFQEIEGRLGKDSHILHANNVTCFELHFIHSLLEICLDS